MSTFTLPNKRLFRPRSMAWKLVGNVSFNRSPTNGVITTGEKPGDAWTIKLEYPPHYTDDRAALRAFYNRFRAMAHVFRCWNIVHPEPRGTIRQATGVTTYSSAVWGASLLHLAVPTDGLTMLAGDMVGVTGNGFPLLLECAEDVVSFDGILSMQLTAPLRYNLSAGSAVTLVRPYADFLLTEAPEVPHEPKVSPPFTIQAVEFIR